MFDLINCMTINTGLCCSFSCPKIIICHYWTCLRQHHLNKQNRETLDINCLHTNCDQKITNRAVCILTQTIKSMRAKSHTMFTVKAYCYNNVIYFSHALAALSVTVMLRSMTSAHPCWCQVLSGGYNDPEAQSHNSRSTTVPLEKTGVILYIEASFLCL